MPVKERGRRYYRRRGFSPETALPAFQDVTGHPEERLAQEISSNAARDLVIDRGGQSVSFIRNLLFWILSLLELTLIP